MFLINQPEAPSNIDTRACCYGNFKHLQLGNRASLLVQRGVGCMDHSFSFQVAEIRKPIVLVIVISVIKCQALRKIAQKHAMIIST